MYICFKLVKNSNFFSLQNTLPTKQKKKKKILEDTSRKKKDQNFLKNYCQSKTFVNKTEHDWLNIKKITHLKSNMLITHESIKHLGKLFKAFIIKNKNIVCNYHF